MAKGKVTIKTLRAGQTVYRVSGRGRNACISKLLIKSRPFKYKNKDSVLNGTWWVNYFKHFTYFKGSTNDSFSLSDAGIYKGHGNYNRTFYTLKAAQRWLDYVKTLPEKDPDDYWDDIGYWDDAYPY